MFRCLLSPRSFNSLERPLACKQASFPITFDGVKLILTSTITLAAYLRSWAFVALVIAIRFMVDQCLFILEALAQVNNNTFFFQQHFMWSFTTLNPCVSSSIWTTHRATNDSTSRFHFGMSTIIPFPTCLSMKHMRPIVPEFYHVLA
jgi:hypothetical protein